MRVKKSRKRSDFVIYSYFKDSVFTAVKRDAKFQTILGMLKGYLFYQKCYIRIKGLVVGLRGGVSPYKTLRTPLQRANERAGAI